MPEDFIKYYFIKRAEQFSKNELYLIEKGEQFTTG